MVGIAVLFIIVLRGIFSAVAATGEIDESLLRSETPRIDRAKIDKAIEIVNTREYTPLDLP